MPGAFCIRQRNTFGEFTLFTNDLTCIGKFIHHLFIQSDDLVQCVGDLSVNAQLFRGHPHGEITILHFRKNVQQ
jgi:hypothetical protein